MAKDPRVIMNASPGVVVGKYDSATYKFMPKERKEILNGHAVAHLIDRWGKYGLVEITWNDALAKQYIDYELYVHERELAALEDLKESTLEALQNFATFEDECGEKQTVERRKFLKLAEERKKWLAQLEKHIEKVQGMDTKKMLSDKASDLRRRAEDLMKEAARISGNDTGKFKDGNTNRAT